LKPGFSQPAASVSELRQASPVLVTRRSFRPSAKVISSRAISPAGAMELSTRAARTLRPWCKSFATSNRFGHSHPPSPSRRPFM
jgi:hypothetical protein